MKSDLVTIKCYGTEKVYLRSVAISEFKTATAACEGHERERYAYILCCLLDGDKYIDDSNV